MEDLSLPEPNIEQWSLPLDPYMETWDNVELTTYAENVLIAECAGDRGYELDVPWRDVSASSRPAHRNPVGRKLFTAELAAEYGYGGPVVALERSADDELFAQQVYAIDDSTWSDCLNQARDDLGVATNAGAVAQAFAMEAESVAESGKEVEEAQQRWRECMLSAGVPDLPQSPRDMPPGSIGAGQGGSEATARVATDAEIALATHDFECRDSSGYREAVYQAEWDAQLEALRENFDDLSRAREAVEDNRESLYAALGLQGTSEDDGEA